MSDIITKIRSLTNQYPIIRGMISYAIIWPACSVTQEYVDKGTTLANADWYRAARFSIFGAFFMCPVFYRWLHFTNRFYKIMTLSNCIKRSVIEQITYSPFALAYFFFGMSLLERKPIEACIKEVREKFWPTYELSAVFWPTAQTVNFYFVPEKHRLYFVLVISFFWTIYLAHVKSIKDAADKQREQEEIEKEELAKMKSEDFKLK